MNTTVFRAEKHESDEISTTFQFQFGVTDSSKPKQISLGLKNSYLHRGNSYGHGFGTIGKLVKNAYENVYKAVIWSHLYGT